MLKSLELFGFKSFADRTVFDFAAGITGVVGPNGSGKSNVVDSIKWILGDQSARSLRGKDMTDVIFSGSASRTGSQFAEATLVFDNRSRFIPVDMDEVSVGRRIWQSGDSEYLVNRNTARLKDVRELFVGTGAGAATYCIIEQGRVDQILQSNAANRRLIFEEAAGISRFKQKRTEALKRLERVETNLVRLSDLVDEVETQVSTVRTQAQRATRFRSVSTELEQLWVGLAADDFVLLANTVVEADITPSVELSGARVDYLLDLPEIDYPLTTRNISAGLATLGAYQIDANTNALTYLQAIATSEQGACFIAANGDLTFTDRLDASFASIAAEFSDTGTDIPYTALQVIYRQEFLYNRIQATIQGGAVQIANDAASQTEFGITTYSLPDLLLQSNSEALTLANYLVALYANPQYRFDDLGLIVSAMSAPNRNAINALELQDVVSVTRTYTTGSPASVTEIYAVERLTHLITAGEHRVTVGLFNTEILYQLVLDDAVFGVLDSTNALA